MINSKNPTGILLARLNQARKNTPGVLVAGLQNYFAANYGKTDLPKVVSDFILYDQQAVVGATNLTFFDGTFSTARSNMPTNNFQLPQSEHALITGIRIFTGANAAIQSTDWKPGVNDAITRNGLLNILNNGVKVTTQLPLTAFDTTELSATSAGETDQNRGYFELMEPIAWLGQTSLNIQASWATAPATANQNLRIELHGVRFIGG